MNELEWKRAECIEREYFSRRDRLDRFVAAAVMGMVAGSQGLEITRDQFACESIKLAEAVLVELERREKGGK